LSYGPFRPIGCGIVCHVLIDSHDSNSSGLVVKRGGGRNGLRPRV